jgi:hypothetical protein
MSCFQMISPASCRLAGSGSSPDLSAIGTRTAIRMLMYHLGQSSFVRGVYIALFSCSYLAF